MARDDLSGAAVHGVIRWMLEPKPLRSRYTGVLFCRSRMRLALLPRFSGFPNDRQRIPMRCREVHPKTSIDPSTALWPRYAMPIQLDRAPSHTSHGTEALSRSGRPDAGVASLCRSLPTGLAQVRQVPHVASAIAVWRPATKLPQALRRATPLGGIR